MNREAFLSSCRNILEDGRGRFDLDAGIVSRVQNNRYTVVSVSDKNMSYAPGETFNLDQTYCSDVIAQERTIYLTANSVTSGIRSHPLFRNMPLQAYISTPILVDKKPWGTLNFSSLFSSREGFDLAEIAFLEESSDAISKQLTGLVELWES